MGIMTNCRRGVYDVQSWGPFEIPGWHISCPSSSAVTRLLSWAAGMWSVETAGLFIVLLTVTNRLQVWKNTPRETGSRSTVPSDTWRSAGMLKEGTAECRYCAYLAHHQLESKFIIIIIIIIIIIVILIIIIFVIILLMNIVIVVILIITILVLLLSLLLLLSLSSSSSWSSLSLLGVI